MSIAIRQIWATFSFFVVVNTTPCTWFIRRTKDDETKKRLSVRADCTLYRNLLFEFKSLIDGINIAPQLFTQILLIV